MTDVPDREVGAFPHLERPAVVLEPERPRRVARHPGKTLFRSQPEEPGGQRHGLGKRAERRRSRVAVGGQRDRDSVPAQRPDRRAAALAERQKGPGKQHRHRSGSRERFDPRLRGVLQMVGGQRPEARRERRPAAVGPLVRVQLDRQPKSPGTFEQPRELRGAEGNGLAETVDGVREAFRGHAGKQLIANEGQVVVGPSPELRWDGVRRQERGFHRQPGGAAEAARHFEHPDLGVEVQPVPGLDLHGGRALAGHRLQAAQSAPEELLGRGGPGGPQGGHDPATGGGQFLVARSSETRLELAPPVAAEDQVRVAVDQGGRDPAPLERACLLRPMGRKFRFRPDPGDLAVPDRERPAVDRTVRIGSAGAHRCDARTGQQQIPAVHVFARQYPVPSFRKRR